MGGAIPHNTVRGHRPKGCPSHLQGAGSPIGPVASFGESPPGEVSQGLAAPGRTRAPRTQWCTDPGLYGGFCSSLARARRQVSRYAGAGAEEGDLSGGGDRPGLRLAAWCGGPRWAAVGGGPGPGDALDAGAVPFSCLLASSPPRSVPRSGAGVPVGFSGGGEPSEGPGPGSERGHGGPGVRVGFFGGGGPDRGQSRTGTGVGSVPTSLVAGNGPGPGPGPGPALERGRLLWWRGAGRGAGTGTGAGWERSGVSVGFSVGGERGEGPGPERGGSGAGVRAVCSGGGERLEVGAGQTPLGAWGLAEPALCPELPTMAEVLVGY